MSARAAVLGVVGLFALPALPTCNVYKSDVERICDAEQRSGKTVKADLPGVMAWLQKSVASAQGVVLENQLQTASPHDRSLQLRSEARNLSLPSCPLADSFEAYAVDDDYRTSMSYLCDGEAVTSTGGSARLDVAPADDAERAREIREWTVTNLKGAAILAFVDRLAAAPPPGRPALLRGEATRLGLASCALALTLERPPPAPIAVTLVALPSYAVTHVDGPVKIQEALTGTLSASAQSQVINGCYGQALVKTPALAGTVNLRLLIDAKGKLAKAEDNGSTLANAGVTRCIAAGLVGGFLLQAAPSDKAPPSKYTASIALAPIKGSAPSGWPQVMPIQRLTPDSTPDAGAPDPTSKRHRGH